MYHSLFNDVAGLQFTSPPYFDLEDYVDVDNEEHLIHGSSYDSWLENFAKPLFDNMCKYAKSGSYILINIKNFAKYNLFDDFKSIGLLCPDITFVKDGLLVNNTRIGGSRKHNGINKIDNREKIMVFQKM